MSGASGDCAVLDERAIIAASVRPEPYQHLLVDGAIKNDCEESVLADAPVITAAGSFAPASINYGPWFAKLIGDLLGARFRQIIEGKLGLDLRAYPAMLTVRGYCARARDGEGYIHTDSKHKIVTVLLYLNRDWRHEGGNLRILRSKDLDDCALEIAPEFGRMLVFRRCDHSWHVRMPYEGPRLSLQMNWVDSRAYARREYLRHRLSGLAKSFSPARYLLHRAPRLSLKSRPEKSN
jgi:SM-20-related protein